ncbi:MAG TPA: sigma-70 family RNA polymerase sigma factor [Caulobacteraceae bacterium]|nr:sigma-70 family RNA polymerase sigma factor [Caulobacteraceae bacterium]
MGRDQARTAADAALTALYRENIARLRTYLARVLKSEADADDVAQEAFLRLCRAEFSELRYPRAVLFKTGYRLALNRMRHRRSNPLDRSNPVEDEVICASDCSAEAAIIAREQEAAYSQALETLSPRCRQVIELRTVQELSYREISDSLGVPVSTLEKHLVRGKRACAEALAGWWRDGGPARPAHQRLALAA